MKSRFPFPSFPNSWFCIASSDELPIGGVIPLHYFGKNLVLFRTEDGKPHLLDAYCPHLGAHLGYGGQVQGDTIQCPFHGWLFNGNGHCINVPYIRNVPPKAQIQSWPIRETNGMIVVYHHEQASPPNWEIPELPEYSDSDWTPFRQVRRWKINSHIQEVVENGVDLAHLLFVHRSTHHAIKNRTLETNGPILLYSHSLTYNLSSTFTNVLGSKAEGLMDVICYGPGYPTVRVYSKSLIELRFLTLFLATPIDEEYIDIRFVFSMKKIFNEAVSRLLGTMIINSAAKTFEEDFPIFQYKIYRSEPMLCEGDGLIVQFRRWVRQFYSDLPAMTKVLIQQ